MFSRNHRTFIFLSLVAFSRFAYAVPDTAPSLDEWIEELPDDAKDIDLGIPRSLGIVSNAGARGFVPLSGYDSAEMNKLSFLRIAPSKQFEWGLKLNKKIFPQIKDPLMIQKLLGVNAFLVDDPSGDYLLIPGSNQKTKLKFKIRDQISNAAGFVKALFGGLGYEGIVLSKKGPFLLVGEAYAGVFGKSSNGILLSKPEYPNEPKNKIGVISFIESKGGYAMFEIMYLTQETFQVPVGTHVISEGRGGEE